MCSGGRTALVQRINTYLLALFITGMSSLALCLYFVWQWHLLKKNWYESNLLVWCWCNSFTVRHVNFLWFAIWWNVFFFFLQCGVVLCALYVRLRIVAVRTCLNVAQLCAENRAAVWTTHWQHNHRLGWGKEPKFYGPTLKIFPLLLIKDRQKHSLVFCRKTVMKMHKTILLYNYVALL